MEAAELREMSEASLSDKLKELSQEAFNLRFRQSMAQLENTARVRQVRRDIARVKTVLNQRRQG